MQYLSSGVSGFDGAEWMPAHVARLASVFTRLATVLGLLVVLTLVAASAVSS